MKELLIIFIILLIIIGGAIYTDKYLENSSQELISMLEKLKEKVDWADDANNVEEIKNEGENIYKKWEETEEQWAYIVLHSELDLIETSFVRMKAQIEEGEFSRSIEEIDACIFLVNHISEKEKFCLKNIF